ncbi:MAG: hypothetical protein RMK18_12585, partial [Armatimonadota bacterium]|nr:hypothetical protein [Armatimonadota bacterium]
WAKGRFPTPVQVTRNTGHRTQEFDELQEIEIRWERDERNFTLWFALPSSVKAEIVLPEIVPESASINVKLVKGEVKASQFQSGHWRIYVSSGAEGKVEAKLNW